MRSAPSISSISTVSLVVQSKRQRTHNALIETALRIIADKGIEAMSVLDITEALGISNGSFYYHFQNKDQLLEVIGHHVLADLVHRIEDVDRADPADRVARGALMIVQQADRNPEQIAILLRVIDDEERLHADLSDRLFDDIIEGAGEGRFIVEDATIATRFCRALVGIAIRLRLEGSMDARLDAITATRTLTLLGVAAGEAADIVERERDLLHA